MRRTRTNAAQVHGVHGRPTPAQKIYADVNFEYPVKAGIPLDETVASFGTLEARPAADRRGRQAPEGGEPARRQGRLRQLSRRLRRIARRGGIGPSRYRECMSPRRGGSSSVRSRLRRPRRIRKDAPLWSLWVLGLDRAARRDAAALAPADRGRGRRGDLAASPRQRAAGSPADTALLLAGVAALTGSIGIGAAWLVTAHRFPGRRRARLASALPLAVPTYIIAYVVRRALRLLPARSRARSARPLRLDVARRVLVPGGALARRAASR